MDGHSIYRILKVVGIILLIVLLTEVVYAQEDQVQTPSDWLMFRHDLQRTGRSPYIGPETSCLKWSFTTEAANAASPVIGPDGTIYIGSLDGNLYAVNPDGSLKWSYDTGRMVESTPAIGADGTIYIGESRDHKFYAIAPEGTLKWYFQTDGRIFSSPAIGADSTIYFCSYDGYFYALNPDGTLRWSYHIGGYAGGSSPAVAADGTIYVFSEAFSVYEPNTLYALNPDSTLRWSYETLKGVGTCPAIGADGTIYFGSYDSKLYALNPDGTLKWSYDTGGWVYSSPAIGSDGTIYFGSRDKRFYALNANGSLKWWRWTEDVIHSSAAIGADGTIYFGSYDGYLYALNPDSTLKWSYETGDWVHSSPAIGANGTIYVGSHDGKLYAFGSTPSDTTPPQTEITECPSGTIHCNDVTFTWTGLDDITPAAELAYSYYLEGYGSGWSDYTPNTSTFYNDLPNGDYTFKVKAKDQADNLDLTPAGVYFTISTGQSYPGSSSSTPFISAEEAINAAKSAITPKSAKGFDMTRAEDLVSQAEQAFGSEQYVEAEALANQAKDLVPQILSAEQAIAAAKSSIEEEKSKGFRSRDAELQLVGAEIAFKAGNFDTAIRTASRANSIAIDMDGDGMLNSKDFAPTVNNWYIYGGGSVIVFGLIVFALVNTRKKRYARAAIEGRKAEIISMIDEALNRH